MFRSKTLTTLGGIAVLASAASAGDQMMLTGTIRDFSDTHPDFERPGGTGSVVTGVVSDTLGLDGVPMLNLDTVTNADDPLDKAIITVKFMPVDATTAVYITSTKDLSNVVLKLTNGTSTVEYKYDDLHQGTDGTFTVPVEYSGMTIEGVWVKTGTNASGDGPGYGEYLYLPKDGQASVDYFLDPDWAIESPQTFDQWFRNVEGVNVSDKLSIVLEDPDGDGVYRYEASKHNGKSFFPIDGQHLGNEGRTHNYHFTYHINTRFTYTDPNDRDNALTFSFCGDDDVWVFINNKLVVDLGGKHSEASGTVNVDTVAAELGLEPGKDYTMDVFFVERHTTESNFMIETTLQFLDPLYD